MGISPNTTPSNPKQNTGRKGRENFLLRREKGGEKTHAEEEEEEEGLRRALLLLLLLLLSMKSTWEEEDKEEEEEEREGDEGVVLCACGAYDEDEEGERIRGNGEWKRFRKKTLDDDDDGCDDDDDDATARATGTKDAWDIERDFCIRTFGFSDSSTKHFWTKTDDAEGVDNGFFTLLLSGWNGFGQLGDGSCRSRTSDRYEPVPIFVRMHIRVRKVALGLFHTVALCDRGAVYGFGQNPQIGAPKDVKYSTVPILLEGGDLKEDEDDIEFISCGSRHTLVATKHAAFAFGCNAKRQCGFTQEEDDEGKDEDEDIYLPRETLSAMSAKATRILSVRCERWSSFVLLEKRTTTR